MINEKEFPNDSNHSNSNNDGSMNETDSNETTKKKMIYQKWNAITRENTRTTHRQEWNEVLKNKYIPCRRLMCQSNGCNNMKVPLL